MNAAESVFSVFVCLMMQPSNVPFDQSLLLDTPKHAVKVRLSLIRGHCLNGMHMKLI